MLRILTLYFNDSLHSAHDPWPNARNLRSGDQSGWRRIASRVRGYLAWMGKQRQLRRAELELASLNDRMLKDIGIGRSEIKSLVRCGRGYSC